MTDTVLFAPGRPGAPALLLRRSGEVLRGTEAELLAQVTGDFALALPGQDVRAFTTELPGKLKPADRMAAARFAHEDQLASDPAGLHVVLGAGSPATTHMVSPLVMARAAQTSATRLYADFDLLSGLGAEPIAFLDRIIWPGPAGYAVDAEWVSAGDAEIPAHVSDEALRDAVFARLDEKTGPPLDLRTGAYRRRAQVSLGRWAVVAAAALVCAGLALGTVMVDARAVQAQAADITQRARTDYQQATGQPAPDDLSGLGTAAAGSDTRFLQLNQALFTATASLPEIEVERLSYEAREGTLRLRLAYPDFDSATALEAAFANGPAQFTTGGVREQSGRFVGDAVIALNGDAR